MRIQLDSPRGISESGRLSRQEDTIFPKLNAVSSTDKVFVMCDGLGGHGHGDVASAVVAQSLGGWINENLDFSTQPTALNIRRAVAYAQEKLNETNSRFEASRYPMGTTMALMAVGTFGVVAAHIGDTRIYHVRPSRNEILYRSRDHSLVNDLFVAGVLNRAEVEASTKKNVLTRAMIAAPAAPQQPDVAFITDIEPGDYFVICSDGMTGTVTDKQLKEVLCNNQITDAQKVVALKMLTDNVPHNHSALLIRVAQVEHEADDRLLVNTELLMCDKMVRRSKLTPAPVAPMPQVAPPVTTAVAPPVPAIIESPVAPVDTPEEAIEQPTEQEAEQEAVEATPAEALAEQVAEAQTVETPTAAPAPQPSKKSSLGNKWIWLALAALLLTGAIAALLLLNKHNEEKPAPKPETEQSSDPDVIINNVLPEEPLDTFPADLPTGSNVAVTPAPVVNDVPLPNARYDTGSNISVPRVKEGDPYPDAFDNKDDYKELDKTVPAEPEPEAKPAQPAPGTVPAKPKSSQTVGASNRGVAVPPPPGRKQNNQAPY